MDDITKEELLTLLNSLTNAVLQLKGRIENLESNVYDLERTVDYLEAKP